MGKRFMVAVLALFFLFGIIGCGSGKNSSALSTTSVQPDDNPSEIRAGEADTEVSFSATFFEPSTAKKTMAASAAPGNADLIDEYKRRVVSVQIYFYGDNGLQFTTSFPVINGKVSGRILGLNPDEYNAVIYCHTRSGIIIFVGSRRVVIEEGSNDLIIPLYVTGSPEVKNDYLLSVTNWMEIRFSGFPKGVEDVIYRTDIILIFDNGDQIWQSGESFYKNATLTTFVPWYFMPPMAKMRLEILDYEGSNVVQELEVDILKLLDIVDEYIYYPVDYSGSSVDIGVIFPQEGFKSLPTIYANPMTDTTLYPTDNTIANLAIVAERTGSISWHKMVFMIEKSKHLDLANPRLYDQTGTPVDATYGSNCFEGEIACHVAVYLNSEAIIEAGMTQKYKLRVDASGMVLGENYIKASILKASDRAYRMTYAKDSSLPDYSIIWSDMSMPDHSMETYDWTGDYALDLPVYFEKISVTL